MEQAWNSVAMPAPWRASWSGSATASAHPAPLRRKSRWCGSSGRLTDRTAVAGRSRSAWAGRPAATDRVSASASASTCQAPPPQQVETLLAVTIKDRASGQAVWEGRASFAVKASSPLATTQLGAAKLAEALFRGFPGRSGETIEVK